MRTRHWMGLLAVVALGCNSADKGDSATGSNGTGDDGSDDGGSDDGGSDDGGSDDGGSGDGGSSDDGGSGDDGSGSGTEVDWESLNGDVPSDPVSAPEFAAVNLDGSARSREDLLGHPTVMWFYPAASTSG